MQELEALESGVTEMEEIGAQLVEATKNAGGAWAGVGKGMQKMAEVMRMCGELAADVG